MSNSAQRRGLWFAGVLLFVGAGAPQLFVMNTMASHGASLLSFEFVATTRRALHVMDEWGDVGQHAALSQLAWDIGFIPGYGLLLWLGASRAHLNLAGQCLGPIAAAADMCENFCLLQLLHSDADQPWPALAAIFASLKFAAIFACLAGITFAWWRRQERSAAR